MTLSEFTEALEKVQASAEEVSDAIRTLKSAEQEFDSVILQMQDFQREMEQAEGPEVEDRDAKRS